MKMTDASARRGTGSAVTLTRKASTVTHNPVPTTERGKRRAARRGADAVLDAALALRPGTSAVLAMSNAEMLTELGVSE